MILCSRQYYQANLIWQKNHRTRLGKKVRETRFHGTEVESNVLYDGKKTRFDVLLEDEDNWIDLEMQVEKESHFKDRRKVYHNQLLSEEMADYCQYGKIKGSIVIFLCTSDYLGMRMDVY